MLDGLKFLAEEMSDEELFDTILYTHYLKWRDRVLSLMRLGLQEYPKSMARCECEKPHIGTRKGVTFCAVCMKPAPSAGPETERTE